MEKIFIPPILDIIEDYSSKYKDNFDEVLVDILKIEKRVRLINQVCGGGYHINSQRNCSYYQNRPCLTYSVVRYATCMSETLKGDATEFTKYLLQNPKAHVKELLLTWVEKRYQEMVIFRSTKKIWKK